jgi:hypothetical protein
MPSKRKQSDPTTLPLSNQISYYLEEAERIAIRAKRGNKSLKGRNTYAENFSDCRTKATRAFREIHKQLTLLHDPELGPTLAEINRELDLFFTPKTPPATRTELRREIGRLLITEVELALKSPAIAPPEYLTVEIVGGTRRYVENVMRQVNRSFQCECYDACGVMVRRLLETLIIEVFEKKGIADMIKDGGNYFMFTALVNKLIETPETPVGRTTKAALPKIAKVLNNCAHNRVFNVGPKQLQRYQTDIEIALTELVSLWDIRK